MVLRETGHFLRQECYEKLVQSSPDPMHVETASTVFIFGEFYSVSEA